MFAAFLRGLLPRELVRGVNSVLREEMILQAIGMEQRAKLEELRLHAMYHLQPVVRNAAAFSGVVSDMERRHACMTSLDIYSLAAGSRGARRERLARSSKDLIKMYEELAKGGSLRDIVETAKQIPVKPLLGGPHA